MRFERTISKFILLFVNWDAGRILNYANISRRVCHNCKYFFRAPRYRQSAIICYAFFQGKGSL